MKINRTQFLNLLCKCLPGVEKGESLIEGADTFIFEDGFVHSFNDNITVSVNLGEEFKTFSGAIKAMEVYKILSKIPSDEIDIDISKDKWSITAKEGKIQMEVCCVENKLGKIVSEVEKNNKEWKEISPDFFEGIKSCYMKNSSDYKGIFINGNTIISMDFRKINSFYIEKEMGVFWISNEAASELLKFSNLKEFSISNNWISFIGEDKTRYSCNRLADSSFPISKVMELLNKYKEPKEKDIEGIMPKGLKDAIDRAFVLSMEMEADQKEGIQLNISMDNIECVSDRKTGHYKEIVEWQEKPVKEFLPVSIYLDNEMVSFGLHRSNSFFIRIEETEKNKRERLIFKTEKSRHVISLYTGK